MTLEYATVPILFQGALDQKKNYKVLLPGAFITLQNCVRRKEALWEKRYGVTSLPKTLATTSPTSPFNPSITSGTRLGLSEDSLVMLDGRNVWQYAQNAQAWAPSQGVGAAIGWDAQQLVRSQFDISTADMAYCNGYVAVTFSGGIYNSGYAIYDAATGTVVITPQSLPGASNSGLAPKVCTVGNYFVFMYWTQNNTTLAVMSVKVLVGSSPSVQALNTATGLSYHYGNFDIENYDGTTAVLAIENSGATGLTIAKVDPVTCLVTVSTTFTVSGAAVVSVGVILGNIYVAYIAANNLNAVVYNGTLSSNSAAVTVGLQADFGNFYNASFTLAQSAAPLNENPAGTTVTVVYDGVNQTTNLPQIYSRYIAWNGTNGATADGGSNGLLYAGLNLASKTFYGPDKSIYFYALRDTTLQPTYFLMRYDTRSLVPSCVAKFAASIASHTQSSLSAQQTSISRVMSDGSRFHTALRVVTSTEANVTQQVGFTPSPSPVVNGVDHYVVNLSGDYVCKSLGRGMQFVSGGLVNHFDGVNSAEIGFHTYPEGLSATQATGGSLSPTSTYNYRVMWEWYDNFGQVHRSAPSIIQSIALTGTNAQFTISIPPIFVSSKDSWYNNTAHGTSYRAVVYLAVAGDATLFYRHDSVVGFLAPGTSSAPLTINIFDLPNQTNELLYTTGGIVENIGPPAARCAHVHKNRMWLGGLENSELWFSKEWVRGEGVAFSDVFRIPIETLGGPVTAMATLDEKLIIFKKDRLYFLVGDGPDDAGNNWDYPEPIHIPSDVGTVQPNTVVEIPGGLIFKSLKGWYTLNRGLQIAYVGAPVEDYNAFNAASATVLGTQNEVRFVHTNGDCLVYNYYFNQWSTFTNYQGVASLAANGAGFYRLGSDGTVYQEIVGQYNDNGATYSMVIETAWFQFRKIQGFQRIYGFTLIGDFFSHHTAQVSIAYDFNSAYNQTIPYNTQTNGTTGPILQLHVQPQIQKCSAMKIKIQDVDNITVGGGASFKPTALTFDIAGKKGSFRLPSGQQIG